MLKELKENTNKKWNKESNIQQNEIINKKKEIIKRNQTIILGLKKQTKRINSRSEQKDASANLKIVHLQLSRLRKRKKS